MAINDDNQSLGVSNKYKKDTQYGKVIFGQMAINLKTNFFSIKKKLVFLRLLKRRWEKRVLKL